MAARRPQRIPAQLAACPETTLDSALVLRALAGAQGQARYAIGTSFVRELGFVASHALHHLALLEQHCREHGVRTGPDFGKAPATIAHERGAPSPSLSHAPGRETEELCPTP